MNKFTIILLFAIAFVSCQTNNTEVTETMTTPNNDYMILATNWYQQSAEMKAIYLQSYNLAKSALVLNKQNQQTAKKPAVVLDIDETVFNNSPFQAKAIETGIGYTPETWENWVNQSKAKALPGALDFLNFAKEQGVEVFYISNRNVDQLAASMKNMKDLNFPNVDSSFILLRKETSDKTARRDAVSENYEIILLIGDNLTDYKEVFAKRTETMGTEVVEQYKADFGTKFIILPNPMYGEWEKAIYKNTYKWTDAQKDSLRRAALISY